MIHADDLSHFGLRAHPHDCSGLCRVAQLKGTLDQKIRSNALLLECSF